jgi:hypothetical protein
VENEFVAPFSTVNFFEPLPGHPFGRQAYRISNGSTKKNASQSVVKGNSGRIMGHITSLFYTMDQMIEYYHTMPKPGLGIRLNRFDNHHMKDNYKE